MADVSPVGLGAVLTHSEMYEKEALVLVWACERFSIYVHGQDIQLETDHKPLERISTTSKRVRESRDGFYAFMISRTNSAKLCIVRERQNISDALTSLNSSRQLGTGEELDWDRAIVENSVPAAHTDEELEQALYDDEELSLVES